MPTQQNAASASTLDDVIVPRDVIDQIDEALAALYGLIQAAIDMLEDDLPRGIEATTITYGLVAYFFRLYHILNDARLLFSTAFDTGDSRRPFRPRHCGREERDIVVEEVPA